VEKVQGRGDAEKKPEIDAEIQWDVIEKNRAVGYG